MAGYSLESGIVFALARARMAEARGLAELVRGMLAWEPAARSSPERALRACDAFERFRVSPGSEAPAAARAPGAPRCLSARDYFIG